MKALKNTEIKEAYSYWSSLESPTPLESRRRGYEFEKILYSIFENENLEPSTSYKSVGEQIDGSFFYLGQTFLLEAKWHQEELPVSSIYSFKGKVDGKFHTSSGVFISIGGFSEDVSDALRFGKTLNILLFDRADMDAIIIKGVPFVEVLKFKIRQAGDTGEAYVNYEIKNTVADISKSNPVYSGSTISHIISPASDSGIDLGNPKNPLFLIICEGKTEVKYLSHLFKNLNFISPVAFQFKILTGTSNLLKSVPTLINALAQLEGPKFDLKGVVVILDEDSKAKKSLNKVSETLKDTIKKSAIGIELLILSFDTMRVVNMDKNQLNKTRNHEIQTLKEFINSKIYIEDNFEEDEGENEIKRILKNIEWNHEEKEAVFSGEEKHSSQSFKSLQELVFFLENEAEGAATNVVPWDSDFLETYKPPDFSEIVYTCLDDYKDEIESLGWTLE